MTAPLACVTGTIHRLGDNVDTDAILPGRYLALRDAALLGTHCLEDHDPEFRRRVQAGDILLAGRNLGCGSSREHAVIALKAAGIRAIVAGSAARIFFRNAINLGLPVLICPEAAVEIEAGRVATVVVSTGGDSTERPDLEGAAAGRRGRGHSGLRRSHGAYACDALGARGKQRGGTRCLTFWAGARNSACWDPRPTPSSSPISTTCGRSASPTTTAGFSRRTPRLSATTRS